MTSATELAPFWSTQTNTWTSDASRSISTLKYTYPEFVGASSNAVVIQRVQQLYSFGPYAKKRALPRALKDVRHYDWTIRVRFSPADVGRPFAVHCFFGAVPSSNFMQAATYVGSAFAFAKPGGGAGITQHFVQIASALYDRGKGALLDPATVTPYLTSQLQWIVTEVILFFSSRKAWLTTILKG
jgi:hypothetical protein